MTKTLRNPAPATRTSSKASAFSDLTIFTISLLLLPPIALQRLPYRFGASTSPFSFSGQLRGCSKNEAWVDCLRCAASVSAAIAGKEWCFIRNAHQTLLQKYEYLTNSYTKRCKTDQFLQSTNLRHQTSYPLASQAQTYTKMQERSRQWEEKDSSEGGPNSAKTALTSCISWTRLSQGCFDGNQFVTNEISVCWAGRIKNMQSKQQKQIESGGEFQQARDEFQTLNTESFVDISRAKKGNRPKFSEKAKLGLMEASFFSQTLYSPSKSLPQSFGKILKVGSATFRSNYEGGHIGSVQLIGINQFRISLDLQSNSTRGNSWFHFTVQGIKGQAKFTIDGFTKSRSLYNNGMKVCIRDSSEGKWRRGGVNISYDRENQEEEERNYQLHFTYFFKNNQHSSVEFAYAFPYGLKRLQNLLSSFLHKNKPQVLGRTYEGREIPLLSIGNPKSKELIVLSARVHPGQTCSSFIMQGLLKELLSENEHAVFLREKFYFKVVPMINMDGVAKGNYRFSAAGLDLNRKWKQPSQQHHPQVFYLKEMILKESRLRKIRMYIDMHGHSRKKNVFFYGCSKNIEDSDQYSRAKAFPYLMSKLHNAFNYYDCSFNIQREKEGTARVAMWKQLKINEIYTLEASMCGSQVGHNYLQSDYERIGKKLCEGISIYFSSHSQSDSPAIKKLSKFNQEVFLSLLSDPTLLKVGNFQESGSQSQPQKGEITSKEEKELTKRLKMSSYHSNLRSKQTAYKQKCDTSIPQQKDLVRQKELFEYLFDIPAQPAEKKYNPPSMIASKRVNSLSRNNNYRTAIKSITYNEEELFLEERNSTKNKTNLLVGWEGAQYRRVRKMAEQNWKREASMGDFEMKGLRGNRLEIENTRTLIPKLSCNIQQNKHRRTTAEMFFKKPQKAEERVSLARDQLNVQCRGRQIQL